MKKTTLYTTALLVVGAIAIGLFYFRGNKDADTPKPQEPVLGQALPAAGPAPTFLFISDVHLNASLPQSQANVDTGMDLWQAFLKQTELILTGPNAPSFVVYTGDLPAHGSAGNHAINIDSVLTGFRRLAENTHKPFFYLPGNNDALAGDYMPFAGKGIASPFSVLPFSNDSFPALNTSGKGLSPLPCYISTPNSSMDYYSVQVEKGLRLIALNTVMYSPATQKYAAGSWPNQAAQCAAQLTWLAAELANAQKAGDKVMLAMHVPPGIDDYKLTHGGNVGNSQMWISPASDTSYQTQFLTLTEQYTTTITGILYGHTHMDELRLLYGPTSGSIVEVAISCPGLTPEYGHNPAFKVVSYDGTSKELLDFTSYYTQLGSTSFVWNTYSFSKIYGATNTTPIYKTLLSMPLAQINTNMGKTFTAQQGSPSYATIGGIVVK
jgi:sphingomyelin phosphodiesterase acid-like 3